MPFTFLLGGARSGKSTLAVRLASAFDGPVVVVATAEARDEDMAERIRAHRDARPHTWETVEAPLGLLSAVEDVREDAFVVLDCLTLWVSNALEVDRRGRGRRRGSQGRVRAGRTRDAVGRGEQRGRARHRAGERARAGGIATCLGRVNGAFAAEASRSFLVVAGRGLPLEEVTPS